VSRSAPDGAIPVGVVVERRKAVSPWIDFVWRPTAILPGRPETAPWSALGGDAACASFYAGDAEIALFHGDTAQYRDNLSLGAPLLWVVLRPTGAEPPFAILIVTADPSEGEAHTEAGTDLVDSVPMPAPIQAAIAAFVEAHHVEQPFIKRARRPSDPQALARRGMTAKDGDES
jgi:hypothetical protein